MPDRTVSLEVEKLLVDDVWDGLRGTHAPLPVAAAFAFHQVQYNAKGTAPFAGYSRDLNIVAAALSRLCPIYTLIDDREGPIPLPVDLIRQRFTNGASQLYCMDGGFFFTRLSIRRVDVPPAVNLIKNAGLSLTCDFYPVVERGHRGEQANG